MDSPSNPKRLLVALLIGLSLIGAWAALTGPNVKNQPALDHGALREPATGLPDADARHPGQPSVVNVARVAASDRDPSTSRLPAGARETIGWTLTFRPLLGGEPVTEHLHPVLFHTGNRFNLWSEGADVPADGVVHLSLGEVSGATGRRAIESLLARSLFLSTSEVAAAGPIGGLFVGGDSVDYAWLLLSNARLDQEARVFDFGDVELLPADRVGAVVVKGVHGEELKLTVNLNDGTYINDFQGRSLTQAFRSGDRSVGVTAIAPPRGWASGMTWYANLHTKGHVDQSFGSATLGQDIQLSVPVPEGLAITIDLSSILRAARVVIPARDAAATQTLSPEQYLERLAEARRTTVIPSSARRARAAECDLGTIRLQRGPCVVEVWSLKNENGERELLWSRSCTVGPDLLPVLMR